MHRVPSSGGMRRRRLFWCTATCWSLAVSIGVYQRTTELQDWTRKTAALELSATRWAIQVRPSSNCAGKVQRRRTATSGLLPVHQTAARRTFETSTGEQQSLFSLLPSPWSNLHRDDDSSKHPVVRSAREEEWIVDVERDYCPVDGVFAEEAGRVDDTTQGSSTSTFDPTSLLRTAAANATTDRFLSLLQEHNERTNCRKSPGSSSPSSSSSLPHNKSKSASSFPEHEAIPRLRLAPSSSTGAGSSIRLLCAVYSHNGTDAERLDTVLRTWAPRCDGFFIGSDVTDLDHSRSMLQISHPGPEAYRNMWNKVRSMLVYMYQHHFHSYDWFHIGGDDMYVVVENLKGLLSCPDMLQLQYHGIENRRQQQRPVYLGDTICTKGNISQPYNTGGPGYTLNRAALHLLVTQALPHWHTGTTSAEDVQTAAAFRVLLGLLPTPARERSTGRHYYNSFSPGRHYVHGEPPFYKRYARPLNFTWGPQHAAEYPVSFHYMSAPTMRQLHAHLYYYDSSKNGTAASMSCSKMVDDAS